MNDVSRGTPPVPPEARGVFPSQRLELVERYADLLATDGIVRGLIGPREADRLWDRHLLNSAAVATLVPDGADLCDIGSGAGLPGVVIAIARPDVQVTLVEPLLRRTTFLEEVVETLALGNLEVVRGRAEALHGIRTFDVVTSRAVAPLPRLLAWSMPLVNRTGAMVAMKGSSVGDEIIEAEEVLTRLGCSAPEVLQVGELSPTTLLRVSWADPATVDSPSRRTGASSRGEISRGQRRGGSRKR